jgi:hypothetical protein
VSSILEVVLFSTGRTEGKHNCDTSSSTDVNIPPKNKTGNVEDGVIHQTEKRIVLNQ